MSNFFTDRVVQHPGRVTATDVESGEVKTFDIARAEGTVTREGTRFNAATMNEIADYFIENGDTREVGVESSFTAEDLKIALTGTSDELYEAINDLGWTSECIE